MTGWTAARAAAAIIGAAVIGPATYAQQADVFVAQPPPPAVEWVQDWDASAWAPELAQAVRIFGGSTGRIGVSIRDLSDDELEGGKSAGVKIDEVETDSPASKAGFKNGDIVVEFDGERVRSSRQFTRLVQETPPGRSVPTVVQRDGQRVTLNVQPRESGSINVFDRYDLAKSPKLPPAAKSIEILPKFQMMFGAGRLGISVQDLSTQLGEYFGTKEGVLVTSVTDSSVASKAGVRAGDVITSLNGGSVNSTSDLRRRAQNIEDGDEFTINVMRDKKPLTLKGKVDLQPTRRPVGRTIL
jgi:serine protease Do